MSEVKEVTGKTFSNTTAAEAKTNVRDIEFWGDGDTFKLISKAYSASENWMKSTKAMEIEGVGCVVQVTTQQGEFVAEALTFVPGVKLEATWNSPDAPKEGKVISRRLVPIWPITGIPTPELKFQK